MSKTGTKIFKWTALVLLLAYSVGMSVWANREAARHVCQGIEVIVEGNPAMDTIVKRGITEELKNYPGKIVGQRLDAVDTGSIERFLGRLSNFETVECMMSSGGILRIKAVPLVPVMRVFFADNSYYINKDGKHIKSNIDFFSDVPVVSGRFKRGFQPVDVLPLVRFIDSHPDLKNLVGMIEARDPANLILVPRITGHVVNFGDTTRLEEKARNLSLFYREVMPYKGWEEYDTVSVKFRGQVVATRRDKSRLNHAEEYLEDIDLEEATLPGGNAPGENAQDAPAKTKAPEAPQPQQPAQQANTQ